MTVHLFGVRHHGPGCARALRLALEELRPDIVLVEGPPDAQDALPLMTSEAMCPPVALLVYASDNPSQAVYYPFARFSPEWQALDFALGSGVPARFIDLPQSLWAPLRATKADEGEDAEDAAESPQTEPAQPGDEPAELPDGATPTSQPDPREDPLALLAQAAGYADHELWWDRQIESRRDMVGFFEAILEAMTELRPEPASVRNDEDALREAHMRQAIRAAQREGYERIAVVTGAWHSPALLNLSAPQMGAKADAERLKGLKRIKTQATWIPWTNSRLAYHSGYGAGVQSPGWYEHLWEQPDGAPARWLSLAARLLREQGLDVSSASVIEGARLATTLAALRDLPTPGLAEMREAIQTALCNGEATPMRLIHDQLEVGQRMGEVPPETPTTPLQRDVEAAQRRLRLPPSEAQRTLDLDLRNDTDRARSQLLWRLRLLGLPWGEPLPASRANSTFHELWTLQWRVEFPIALIEANTWGNTVAQAATAKTLSRAESLKELPPVAETLDVALLADLPEAITALLDRLRTLAASTADVRLLMDTLPRLARVARYGDVRGGGAREVLPVYQALFERALIGLPMACAGLDDDAAATLVASIERAHEAVALLDNASDRAEWTEALRGLVTDEHAHGLVRGRCCRLLLDMRALDEAEVERLARLALSPIVPRGQAAAWVDGILSGSAMALLYHDGLWRALDAWLCDLSGEDFVALLPILRRAFARFEPPERRAMGEKARNLHTASGSSAGGGTGAGRAIVRERADLTLPTLARILGAEAVTVGATGRENGGETA